MSKVTTDRASAARFGRVAIIGSSALLALSLLAICPRPASAAGFNPVIDEFWIIKNSSEIFRDSFNDGTPPPSGPNDGTSPTGATYITNGATGFVGESGGKLTIDPSLGGPCSPVTTCGGFTNAIRLFGGNDTSPSRLSYEDSFEMHGLFDISASSTLPGQAGESFGIRATDANLGGPSNDRAGLRVTLDSSGHLRVAFVDQDFSTPTPTSVLVGSDPIESLIVGALSIELILSKGANSSVVYASYIVSGPNGGTGSFANGVTIYDGENLTRAEFNATAAIATPLPATLPLMAGGAGVLGLLGWRRKRKAVKAAA